MFHHKTLHCIKKIFHAYHTETTSQRAFLVSLSHGFYKSINIAYMFFLWKIFHYLLEYKNLVTHPLPFIYPPCSSPTDGSLIPLTWSVMIQPYTLPVMLRWDFCKFYNNFYSLYLWKVKHILPLSSHHAHNPFTLVSYTFQIHSTALLPFYLYLYLFHSLDELFLFSPLLL